MCHFVFLYSSPTNRLGSLKKEEEEDSLLLFNRGATTKGGHSGEEGIYIYMYIYIYVSRRSYMTEGRERM
jgi:hypothetical protein